jgi:hypothetical protein
MIRLFFFFFFQTNLFWGLIPLKKKKKVSDYDSAFFFLQTNLSLGALGDRQTRLMVEPALLLYLMNRSAKPQPELQIFFQTFYQILEELISKPEHDQ